MNFFESPSSVFERSLISASTSDFKAPALAVIWKSNENISLKKIQGMHAGDDKSVAKNLFTDQMDGGKILNPNLKLLFYSSVKKGISLL